LIVLLGITLAAGAPIAYLAMATAGLPTYLALRHAGLARRLPLWMAGGAVGATVAWLLGPSLKGELFSIPFPAWAGATLGMLTCEVFWRLLAWRGDHPPENSAPVSSDARPRDADAGRPQT
jgi:hypothetical protein